MGPRGDTRVEREVPRVLQAWGCEGDSGESWRPPEVSVGTVGVVYSIFGGRSLDQPSEGFSSEEENYLFFLVLKCSSTSSCPLDLVAGQEFRCLWCKWEVVAPAWIS